VRHVYECPNCRVIGDPRVTRADAASDRTAHRNRAHHGLAPSGHGHGPTDSIQAVPGLLGQFARGAIADLAAGQRRHPTKARATSPANARAERLATISFFIVLVICLLVITK
jgi:hypothetical protein